MLSSKISLFFEDMGVDIRAKGVGREKEKKTREA